MSKKMCIIGAGSSGLCVAKEIRENNPEIEVKIFESSSVIGGVFSHCYQGLNLVNNPFLVSFSDFPPKNLSSTRMWTAEEYVEYLTHYAEENNVAELIHFNCNIVGIEKSAEAWRVGYQQNTQQKEEFFDYVTVCTGANHSPRPISLPNQKKFSGEIKYAGNIKSVTSLKDKTVIFVGLGETSSDLIYLSRNLVKKSYVSIRRWPGYFIPRYHDCQPTDLDTSKVYHSLSRDIDSSKLSFFTRIKRKIEYYNISSSEDKAVQKSADHFNQAYKSISHLGPFRRISTKSCGFIKTYIKKKISLKPKIIDFDQKKVFFDDGTMVSSDTIVLCTGQTFKLDFLPEEIRFTSPNELYKHIFSLQTNSCFFIGFVRPNLGSLPSISELQARYLSSYLKKELTLPNNKEKKTRILAQQEKNQWQFPLDFERVGHIVDYYQYTRCLAKELGVLPKQLHMFFSNIRLWYKVNFSFLYPGIYRLYPLNAKSQQVIPIIEKLPTMPKKILFLEVILFFLDKTLSNIQLVLKRIQCFFSKRP